MSLLFKWIPKWLKNIFTLGWEANLTILCTKTCFIAAFAEGKPLLGMGLFLERIDRESPAKTSKSEEKGHLEALKRRHLGEDNSWRGKIIRVKDG